MMNWFPNPPSESLLLDHDVELLGPYLENKRIALMVCGGIAAMKAPLIARSLRRFGADVVAYVSSEALRYTTLDALEWSTCNKVITKLSAQSEHLSKAKGFDAYLVAPATYNTINKFRHGVADSVITTTLASSLSLAIKGETEIFIAPTMHGDFHNPIFEESVHFLKKHQVKFIPPRDAYGKHNIPTNQDLSAFVCHHLSQSKIKNKKILVTSGSTPTYIDSVRCLSNRFRGRLGLEISRHLHLSGAQVTHLYGAGAVHPDSFLRSLKARDFNDYKEKVMSLLEEEEYDVGIFSAAVSDYQPVEVFPGKIKSGGILKSIELKPTEKVIDLVRERFPQLQMVSFKFESNIDVDELLSIGRGRVQMGHSAVVVNRDEDSASKQAKHKAYLVYGESGQKELKGKKEIAYGLVDYLNSTFE